MNVYRQHCSKSETFGKVAVAADLYQSLINTRAPDRAKTLETLFSGLPKPNIDNWQSDAAFVKHFLEGVNPMVSKSSRYIMFLRYILEPHIESILLTHTLCSLLNEGETISHFSRNSVNAFLVLWSVHSFMLVNICRYQSFW